MKNKHIIGLLAVVMISSLLYSCSNNSKDVPVPPEGNVTDFEGIASRNLLGKKFYLTNYQKVDGQIMASAMDQIADYYKDDTIKFVTDIDHTDPNKGGSAALFLGQDRGTGATNDPFISDIWNVHNGSKWADGTHETPPTILFPFFTNKVNNAGDALNYIQGELENIDTTGSHIIIYVREQNPETKEIFRSTLQSVN